MDEADPTLWYDQFLYTEEGRRYEPDPCMGTLRSENIALIDQKRAKTCAWHGYPHFAKCKEHLNGTRCKCVIKLPYDED